MKTQRKVYAFLVANTSVTYRDIADMTDPQIGDLLELDQFQAKD